MEEKKTNLALAADVTTKKQLLSLADKVGPEICILKTHIDIIEDFSKELIRELVYLAGKHQFFLLEDRKFSDIGTTVQLQYEKGIYQIVDWADLITSHSTPGPAMIEGLQKIGLKKGRGAFLIAEMSSEDNLARGEYTKKTVQWAERFSDFVVGFITQHKLTDKPQFIHMTPGIQFETKKGTLGQHYQSPDQAIEKGSDILIVGRGIYSSNDPKKEAILYKNLSWQAYKRCV
ncbi:MAG: orotidine-5'-phosphate decarboxylase [Chlamydiae bacterium]|nr:orotidine-5'-phosphate decarboxylase [Chlamydiota bacterium]